MPPSPLTAADRAAARAALLEDPRYAALPAAKFARIIDAGEWRRLPAGARLFSAGDEGRAVVAVAQGFLAMESALAIPELPLVAMVGAPFWSVGRPLVQGRIRLATATARTALTTLVIPIERFEALEAEDPLIRDFKAMVAGQLFFDALEGLADALRPDNQQRTIATLLRIAGRKQGGDMAVTVPLGQGELAALSNLSRQTCGELLRRLESEGLLQLGYREIVVGEPARLRALIA